MFILIFQGVYLYFYDLYRITGDREDFEKIISDHANAAGNIRLFNNRYIYINTELIYVIYIK